MSYGSISLATNTVATIVTANAQRYSIVFTNIGAGKAYIGEDSSISSANGILLVANGGSLTEDSGGQKVYMGEYYGIAGSASTTLTYWQRTRGSG